MTDRGSTDAGAIGLAAAAAVSDDDLTRAYSLRFSAKEQQNKHEVWREITAYLQQWIDEGHAVLDLACDAGHFVRNVRAADRWAVDVRDVSAELPPDVRFVQCDGLAIGQRLPHRHFGTVFMSNYLEHLPSSKTVLAQLQAVRPLLRPGGRVVILQPNIRYVKAAYWDFLDHKTPLTERSLVEACELAGIATERVIPRFLPYTTKTRLPQRPWMVRAYLRFPPAWRILGQQTLYIGRNPSIE